MQWWKRIIRITRIGLLALAAVSLLLYAASTRRVWWYAPWRTTLWARDGELVVHRYGPGATMARLPARAGIGGCPIFPVPLPPSGKTVQTGEHWLWTTEVVRAVAVPGSGPPPKPGSYFSCVGVKLGRLALIAGLLGGLLLLVRTRVHTRGSCPACGYDRSGLVSGSACPECGAASAEAMTGP